MVATLEHGLRLVVKIRAQPVLVGAWLAIGEVGLGCLWIGDEGGVGWDLQLCDVYEEWASDQWRPDRQRWVRGRRRVEEEERKKKKKLGRRVIWAMGRHDLGSRGGMIWVGRILAGWPPMLSLSLSLSESWNSFEGKIETKIHFRLGRVILLSMWKLISVCPNFLCLPNT